MKILNKKFKVKLLSEYHPIFAEAGITKREHSPELKTFPYINKSLNRYIDHQFLRLNKAKTNPHLFWRIAEQLLKRSSSFMTLCLHETSPGWHRNQPYSKIWRAVRGARELDFSKYEHYLVAIAKNGITNEKRYLNVPTLSWRLYLHGLNKILMVWLECDPTLHQHGISNKSWM